MASISDIPLPTTKNLKAARRSAARFRAFSACPPCRSIKQKCDNQRPCSRCKRIGRENRCLSQDDESSIEVVERPVSSSSLIKVSARSLVLPDHVNLKYDWSRDTVMRYWQSGYRCEELANLFNSLPEPLPHLLDMVLSSLKLRQKCLRLGKRTSLSETAQVFGSASPQLSEAFWDAERVYGCVEISFDPSTGQRHRIFINDRFAQIYGHHKEELLARFANYDADLQRTEIDSLMMILDGVQHALDDSETAAMERYFRIYSGPQRMPVLVWTLWGKAVNYDGKFCKGSMIVKVIGPDDYDGATRSSPSACPLRSAGDDRSGRELLAQMPEDLVVAVRDLPQCPRG